MPGAPALYSQFHDSRRHIILDLSDWLIIPFGAAQVDPNRVAITHDSEGEVLVQCPTPYVRIQPARQASLRLNDAQYVFPEAPDLRTMSDATVQLNFLRHHLQIYCDLWRKSQKIFLEKYFEFIMAQVEDSETTLTVKLKTFGGLYDYRDWALSAPRPLPRALIHTPEGPGTYTPVEFAFWVAGKITVVLLAGTGTPTQADTIRRTTLERRKVEIIDISVSALQKNGVRYLSHALPDDFTHFWEGEIMPSSPFKGATLGEIIQF